MPGFTENRMYGKYGTGARYETSGITSAIGSRFPSFYFYLCLAAGPFRWLAKRAARGECDDYAWTWSSAWVGDIIERCGARIIVEGMDNLRSHNGPVVYIANHMSTLETFLLPGLIRPEGKVTFIVKKSLVEIPLFGPIMRSRNPVTVERKNPREDLTKVLTEGCQRLESGFSVVVFPQSTRSSDFSREHFNSIGTKLARRANVPVLPIALKTDAWGLGKRISELGRIRPSLPIHIKIGALMEVTGTGKAEHVRICDFIESNLLRWQKEDGVNQ